VPGKYELIPAAQGEYAFADTNPMFIGSVLVQPCNSSYATAAFFHGPSTQTAATGYVAANARYEGLLVVRDKEYRVVTQPAHSYLTPKRWTLTAAASGWPGLKRRSSIVATGRTPQGVPATSRRWRACSGIACPAVPSTVRGG